MLVTVETGGGKALVNTDTLLASIKDEYPDAHSVELEPDGSLTVNYNNSWEYYVYRNPGEGTSNSYWASFEWEFCGSGGVRYD